MAEKKGYNSSTDTNSETYKPKVTMEFKSIIATQKVVPESLTSIEQL